MHTDFVAVVIIFCSSKVPDTEKKKEVGTITISIKTEGESITNTSKVLVSKKISNVLVQTDKAVYKPGQTGKRVKMCI